MRIVYFKVLTLLLAGSCLSKPIDDGDENDLSGHLGPIHNQGAPLYYDTGHQNYEEEYPGYDGYASYAPHHDHEHYAYPRYKFEYGVHDPHTGDIKKQYEERDGDVVRGYYSLVEPDGSIRIVEYTADDKHGFQAHVRKIGPSHHPPSHHPPAHHHHPEHHYYPKHQSHDHSYEDQFYYPPAQQHNTYYDDEEDHSGYGIYGQKKNRRPPVPAYGDFSSPYHNGPSSAEYEENDDYPYHSNINYPVYVLPHPSYAPIQELTAYDALEKDFENANKFYKKRSPFKKTDKSFKVSTTEKSKVEPKESKIKEAQRKEDKVDEKKSEKPKVEKQQSTTQATTSKSSKVQTEKPKDKS